MPAGDLSAVARASVATFYPPLPFRPFALSGPEAGPAPQFRSDPLDLGPTQRSGAVGQRELVPLALLMLLQLWFDRPFGRPAQVHDGRARPMLGRDLP